MINDGNDFKRRAPPRSALEVPSWNLDTLLQTAPPTRIYLKSSHHGVLAFANLDEDITVGELKTLVYERLMLSPNQTVVLSSWGRALDESKRLCDLSLPTNARLEMRLALCALDPSRGLERLRALGLTPAILDFVMLFLWGFLWVMLLLALTLYAHAAPATAGIGPAAFGHSFALARACLLLTSLAGMGVGAHVLQFWDEATVRELFAEIQGAGLLTLGLYTLLLCQAALYAVVALVEIDLGVLVCLVGVYYLVEKSAAVLVAYVVLAAATLPFDLLVVVGWKAANMDFWGWAAGTAYSFIIVLKAATLCGMVVRHTKVKCNFKFFGSNTHEELDA